MAVKKSRDTARLKTEGAHMSSRIQFVTVKKSTDDQGAYNNEDLNTEQATLIQTDRFEPLFDWGPCTQEAVDKAKKTRLKEVSDFRKDYAEINGFSKVWLNKPPPKGPKDFLEAHEFIPDGQYKINNQLYEFVPSEQFSESEKSSNGREARAGYRRKGPIQAKPGHPISQDSNNDDSVSNNTSYSDFYKFSDDEEEDSISPKKKRQMKIDQLSSKKKYIDEILKG